MGCQRLFLSPPHMGGEELEFIKDAFASNYIAPLGPMVDGFERRFVDYTGIKHCAAVSSGTAAMHLALRCIGVAPGDEVFVSTLTFIGGITPILFEGATPVFIDSERASWNMDPELLQEELHACEGQGKLPKAVIPTDLYGQCSDYDRILTICDSYGIPVIIDAAESMGAIYHGNSPELPPPDSRLEQSQGELDGTKDKIVIQNSHFKIQDLSKYRHAGKGAKAAVFSFNGNKIITTSGGGMLASDDNAFIEQARFLSQQARDPAPHYEHTQIGYNYRMSNILAAIGLAQLQVLDERVEKKRWIFEYYRQAIGDLQGIELMPEATFARSTRWLTVILVHSEEFGTDREAVRLALEAENIESRPVWKPMHMQPVFACKDESQQRDDVFHSMTTRGRKHRARVIGGLVSEFLFERGLCLPSGTQITEKDLDRVVRTIRRLYKR